MTLIIDRARDAQVDVIDEAYYLADDAGMIVANRFLDAVTQAYERLAETPGIGAPRDYGNLRYAGMRMSPVPKFPKYLIFYRVEGDTLKILRVLHGARDLQAIFGPDDEDNE